MSKFSAQVVSYIEKEAPAKHPAFGTAVSARFQETVAQANKHFLEKVSTYPKASLKNLGWDPASNQNATWTDVLKIMADSEVADEAKAKGWRGILHYGGRKIGDGGAALQSWLVLVPGDSYTSLLSGGLKLVVNAAQQKGEVREKAQQALKDIPEALDNALQFWEVYPHDKELPKKMLELHVTMLAVFEWILDFYHHNRIHSAKAFFKQDSYVAGFEQKANAVQAAVQSLKNQFDLRLHQKVGDVSVGIADIQDKQSGILDANIQIAHTLEEQFKKSDLLWHLLQRKEEKDLGRDAVLYSIQKQLEFRLQPGELPEILQVSPDTWATDVSAYQSIRGPIQTENANVDQYIIQTTHFRAWLSSKYSDVLGILDIFVDGEVSPLSTFAATFLLNLQRLPLFLTLSYFCQPHTNDHLAGGGGLLRSLISQLSAMVTLDGLPRQETLASCQSLPGLMDLFEKLLATLADVAVFCVLDGIHFCDSNQVFAEEVASVLTRLTYLASIPHPRIIFKLLVTGNGSSWFFKDGLSVSKQLLIEEDFAKNQEDTTEELISAELAWQMGNGA